MVAKWRTVSFDDFRPDSGTGRVDSRRASKAPPQVDLNGRPEWRHFVLVIRAVLIKGAGPGQVLSPMLMLTGFPAALFFLSHPPVFEAGRVRDGAEHSAAGSDCS